MFEDINVPGLVYYRLFDFLINSIPSMLQIYINILNTFALLRFTKQ